MKTFMSSPLGLKNFIKFNGWLDCTTGKTVYKMSVTAGQKILEHCPYTKFGLYCSLLGWIALSSVSGIPGPQLVTLSRIGGCVSSS